MTHPGGAKPCFPPWAPDLALDLREATGLPLRKIADDLLVSPGTLRTRCSERSFVRASQPAKPSGSAPNSSEGP